MFKGNEGISNQRSRLKRDVSEKRSSTHKEKANAIQRAGTQFDSENPFFMLLMTSSYVAPRYDWVSLKHLKVAYYNGPEVLDFVFFNILISLTGYCTDTIFQETFA